MTVAAHDQEIGGAVGSVGQNGIRDVNIGRNDPLDIDLQSMARKMMADVGTGNLVVLGFRERYPQP